MTKYLLVFTSFFLTLSCSAGINLGSWSSFNSSRVNHSEKRVALAGMSSAMLTGTFSCALTQTNPNCLETQNYLPGLQGAISQGQLQPTLFCYTLMLSGQDVTSAYQDVYCNNPGALPSGMVVLPLSVSTYNITGNQSVSANTIQSYSYPNTVGNYYAWNVVNGTIISGQGTETIVVQWSIDCGIVQVVEFVDGICPAPTVCMDVQITGANCVYPGCTLAGACNYDALANSNDGSCIFPNSACDDLNSNTYNDTYNSNCECIGIPSTLAGCTSPAACNYNAAANQDDGSCTFPGCTDNLACNYDPFAGCSNNPSCLYPDITFLDCQGNCLNDSDGDGICDEYETSGGCTDITACNYDAFDINPNDDACVYGAGCVIVGSCNYNGAALCDDGSCVPSGCTDIAATNFNALAGCDNGSCIYINVSGCTDPVACNFNINANVNDGSCIYLNPGVINGASNPLIGDTVTYSTPFAAGYTYSWLVSGGGNIISQNQNSVIVQWNSTGNYFVELTITSGLCTETTTLNVNVDCNFPAITILGDQGIHNGNGATVTYSTGMVAGASYNWTISTQPANSAIILSGIGTNSIQVQFTSSFVSATLSVSVGDASCSDSYSITLTDDSGRDDRATLWSLYPNPAEEFIFISGFENTASLTYQIIDISGRTIAAGALQNSIVHLNDLASATYVLELRSNGQPLARRRFVKN